MIESEPTADRVREYLGRLTSQARSRLLVEIERMQLYGEDIPASAIILAQLRAEFRKAGEAGDRIGNPSRRFRSSLAAPGGARHHHSITSSARSWRNRSRSAP